MYYTYMLRCKDNSIYTGITTDLEKRFKEHCTKDEKCAKYTKTHSVIKIEMVWKSEDRVKASKLEYRIKHLTKQNKEELIKNPELLEKFLGNVLDVNDYKVDM